MSVKNKKQFGVWMDSQYATIAGRESIDNGDFVIIGHAKRGEGNSNSNEHTSNNQEITLVQKYFKAIASNMPNIDEIHITGTGQIQEEFIKFLGDTPQYKNAVCTESTSTKMGEEQFVGFVKEYFN